MANKPQLHNWRAEYESEDFDAPWTEEALRKAQTHLRKIDVCGAMEDCTNEVCPCALLEQQTIQTRFCPIWELAFGGRTSEPFPH